MTKHLLSLNDLTPEDAHYIIEKSLEIKATPLAEQPKILRDQTAVLLFDKPSTRTRSSFATGIANFGGTPIFISADESQMGRGEPVEDSAKILSSMFSLIVIRTFAQDMIEELAKHASVPVINALTDDYHPCQILADILTYVEHRGSIKGKKVAWLGDGNNVCHSWMNATRLFDFDLHIACPEGYEPSAAVTNRNKNRVTISHDVDAVAAGADLVVTDTWASMGQEEEKKARTAIFMPYQVNQQIMDKANKDALFMHCLPAYRGYEVTAEVIDGKQSVIWDEAENRLHAQKGLMHFLLDSSQALIK